MQTLAPHVGLRHGLTCMLLSAGALGARACDCWKRAMKHDIAVIVSLVLMIGLIVGHDVAFLRDRFFLRLIVNVTIVATFGVLYLAPRHLL